MTRSTFIFRLCPRATWRLQVLCGFARDRRGATAVEFGLIAVPFFGLLVAIFQLGLVFMYDEGLEAAVQDAGRKVMTGQAQAQVTTASQFVSTYMCPSTGQRILPSFIDCNQLMVDIRTASAFSGTDTSGDFYQNVSTRQFCLGSPGQIVIVRVAYPMPVFLPLFGTNGQIMTGLVNNVPGSSGWKRILVGTSVFQTEPYPAATYTVPSGC